MKKISKKFLPIAGLSLAAICFAATAQGITYSPEGSNDEITINAYVQFDSAFRNQSGLGKDKNISANHRNVVFYNKSALKAELKTTKDVATFGARVILAPTTPAKGGSAFAGSHLFAETEYGRFEAGSPLSASYNMGVSGDKMHAGIGDWDRHADFTTESMKVNGLAPSFASCAEFYLDSKLVSKIDNFAFSKEPSRRVTYYTPKLSLSEATKVQLGGSYTPDSANTGAGGSTDRSSGKKEFKFKLDKNSNDLVLDENALKNAVDAKFDMDLSVKDAVSGGLNVFHNFAEGVDLEFGVTGELGKSVGRAVFTKNGVEEGSYKLKDLKAVSVGAVLTVDQYSVGASYGTLGKSTTVKEFHKTGRTTDYYAAGLGYEQGPAKVSLTYFRSEQYKNIVNAVTAASSYKLAPGCVGFVELTGFNLHGRPEFFVNAPKRKSKGTVAIIGMKISL